MLKIRLKRVGRKNDPSFRIVVVESRRGPKSNDFIERVGFYNPKTKERELNGERISYWIGNGAQVSDTVHNMLVDAGIIDGKKKNVLPQKSRVVKEEEKKTEEKVEAPAAEAGSDTGEDPSGGSSGADKPASDQKEETEKEPEEQAPVEPSKAEESEKESEKPQTEAKAETEEKNEVEPQEGEKSE